MEHADWARFAAFGVEFGYPNPTPAGHVVERKEDDRDDMQRVHLSSPTSGELYFEATRLVGVAPEEEYARHRPYLERRFGDGAVTELEDGRYTFHWSEGERAVVLRQNGEDTYRFIYDPRSPLNEEILATVTVHGKPP